MHLLFSSCFIYYLFSSIPLVSGLFGFAAQRRLRTGHGRRTFRYPTLHGFATHPRPYTSSPQLTLRFTPHRPHYTAYTHPSIFPYAHICTFLDWKSGSFWKEKTREPHPAGASCVIGDNLSVTLSSPLQCIEPQTFPCLMCCHRPYLLVTGM